MRTHSQAPLVFAAKWHSRSPRGFVTLLSMLIVVTVCITITIPLLISSVDLSRTRLDRLQGSQARVLADACAEIALQKLYESKSYAGSESFALLTGTCDIRPVLPFDRTGAIIQTIGTAGQALRKLSITVEDTRPSITISSWQEVGDF